MSKAAPSSGRLFLLLKEAASMFEAAGVARPRWTADQLLSRRLGCKPIELYLEPERFSVITRSDSGEAISFQADVAARANGVPLQYLMGSAEFYGREFLVGPGVFIPRPETEVLVSVTLELLEGTASRGRGVSGSPSKSNRVVVDVGTGSGAIAVTLALEHPGIRVIATDLSSNALAFARRNAARLGAAVSFLQENLIESLKPMSADLIVANLPYLDSADSSSWPRELHWDPWLALDGGEGGLSLIHRLIHQAGPVLKPEGKLVLEIGMGQAEWVQRSAENIGFELDQIVPDLAGVHRVVVFRMSSLRESPWRN